MVSEVLESSTSSISPRQENLTRAPDHVAEITARHAAESDQRRFKVSAQRLLFYCSSKSDHATPLFLQETPNSKGRNHDAAGLIMHSDSNLKHNSDKNSGKFQLSLGRATDGVQNDEGQPSSNALDGGLSSSSASKNSEHKSAKAVSRVGETSSSLRVDMHGDIEAEARLLITWTEAAESQGMTLNSGVAAQEINQESSLIEFKDDVLLLTGRATDNSVIEVPSPTPPLSTASYAHGEGIETDLNSQEIVSGNDDTGDVPPMFLSSRMKTQP
jgi:hypothetical protein